MGQFEMNFEEAFGYYPPPKFVVEKAPARKETSELGQPFYKQDLSGREFFLPVELDGVLIPFAVLSVSSRKIIVSTPMPERGGQVHEIISVDDYSINIKGILIEDDYPEKAIRELHDIFKKNKSISLRSVLTDIFLTGESEHKVVIKGVNWPALAAVENAKPFEIECVSDTIFILEGDKLIA